MEVRVHGRHVHLDEPMRDAARQKVAHAARFWENVTSADVEFTEEKNPRISSERFKVEITAAASGQVVRAEGIAESSETALDSAVERLERRLRDLKKRLITRSRRPNKALNEEPRGVEDEEEPEGPTIVRTKQFVMKPMTPTEAALQMQLAGHSFFFFQNADSDLPSVLYRRRDGTYGLIEPA